MKRVKISIITILFFSVVGCGAGKEGSADSSDEPTGNPEPKNHSLIWGSGEFDNDTWD